MVWRDSPGKWRRLSAIILNSNPDLKENRSTEDENVQYFLISILLIASCGSYQIIKHDQDAYQSLNKKLFNKMVVITDKERNELEARNVIVGLDSTSVGAQRLATESIRTITIEKSGIGKGILYGLSSSLVLAGSMYLVQQDQPYSEMGFIILPPLGLVGGLVIGTANGDDDVFILNSQQYNDQLTIRVEITRVVEIGHGYIVVLWQGKMIRLMRPEYSYRGTTDDDRLFIMVKKNVYLQKFK